MDEHYKRLKKDNAIISGRFDNAEPGYGKLNIPFFGKCGQTHLKVPNSVVHMSIYFYMQKLIWNVLFLVVVTNFKSTLTMTLTTVKSVDTL